jgi:hypothetical protein
MPSGIGLIAKSPRIATIVGASCKRPSIVVLAVIRYAKIHGTEHRPWLTTLHVAEKHIPFFKTGKELRESLNSLVTASPR